MILHLEQARPDCCATCTYWRVTPDLGCYCPVEERQLRGDLKRMRCSEWRRELYETFACELWDELIREEA